LEFCELGGPAVGICLDTGNPLAVAEEPLAFFRKVAHKVRHIHLKDYRCQPTEQGYRLVRCAIGDGAVPFEELQPILGEHHEVLRATVDPGALTARHVELLTDKWWQGYSSRWDVSACLEAAKRNALSPDEDYRTPWEKQEPIELVQQFEVEQFMKSVYFVRS